MWLVASQTVGIVGRIFDAEKRKQISGVVGSYEVTRQSIEFDTRQALFILALISLSLAVVNLFPFLPLDGGHIFWSLVEAARQAGLPSGSWSARRWSASCSSSCCSSRSASPTTSAGLTGGDPISADPALRQRGFPVLASPAEERWKRRPRRCSGLRAAVLAGAHAQNLAVAFGRTRRAARRRPAIVMGEGDDYASPGTSCADQGGRVAGGLRSLGLGKGDTVALMLNNRPEFMPIDLAAVSLGAVPFSIYQTSSPEQIQYVVADAGAKIAIVESAYLDVFNQARAELPALEHLIVIDGEAGVDPAELEQLEPGFDPSGAHRRRRARRPADPDLHLRHHRAAEGRPAHPPQPDDADRRRRGHRRLPRARRQGDLLAARRAHRRARRPLLPARGPRPDGDDLPRPAQDHRVPAEGAADLVLRGAADLGEAEGRAGGEARQAPGRAASRGREGARGGDSEGAPRAGRRGGPRGACGGGREGRRGAVRGFARRPRPRRGGRRQRRAAPTPVEVLEFFHAIGIPIGELWGMSETCGARLSIRPRRSSSGPSARRCPGSR